MATANVSAAARVAAARVTSVVAVVSRSAVRLTAVVASLIGARFRGNIT